MLNYMDRKYLTIGIITITLVILIVFISGCVNKPTQEVDDTGSTVVKSVGETESSFLIQKINSDSVEGLWYLAYPVPREEGTPKTLHIGDDIGYACEGVSEKLTSIDFSGQKVTFTKIVSEPPIGGCPICLSGNTLIGTPNGNINVKELKKGML